MSAMEMRLPLEKLERLSSLSSSTGVKERQALARTLVGMLQHVCNVVCPDCTFLHHIYKLLARMHNYKPHYSVRLNTKCHVDLETNEWWVSFLEAWNCILILCPLQAASPLVKLWLDHRQ